MSEHDAPDAGLRPLSGALPYRARGERGPLIAFLHWLGGSAETWREVAHGLASRGYRAVAIDLPGFGGAVNDRRWSVEAMADAVATTVATLRASEASQPPEDGCALPPWLLVGHSMGGKVAAILARFAADHDPRVQGLAGLVLVSASPPSPEPMAASKRAELLENLGRDGRPPAEDHRHAQHFVTENSGTPALSAEGLEEATAIVLSMSRAAWAAWLTSGSGEDWRRRVGRLPQPLLVFHGECEGALGAEAQRAFVAAHAEAASNAEIVELAGAAHLAPLERPGELVERIARFAARVGLLPRGPVSGGTGFFELLGSPRTSAATRAVYAARLSPAPSASPSAFDEEARGTLRSLVERVVPGAPPEVAGRLLRALDEGAGDGSRFASLPPDREAWRCGLSTLDALSRARHGDPFVALAPSQQDAVLELLQASGDRYVPSVLPATFAGTLDGPQAVSWFQDVRGEIAKMYMSDPRTLDRVGFRGFADEGGFTKIKLGEAEDFER